MKRVHVMRIYVADIMHDMSLYSFIVFTNIVVLNSLSARRGLAQTTYLLHFTQFGNVNCHTFIIIFGVTSLCRPTFV